MGVHRITSVVKNQRWVPTDSTNDEGDAACRLWRDWDPSLSLSHHGLPIQKIPKQSLILIDGNGLAFYLFKVAYARYLISLFPGRKKSTFPSVNTLSPSDSTLALPCMMPLNLLEDVTLEFTARLRLCNLEFKVFWDGPSRRFKTITLKKRMEQRHQQWSNMHQYCLRGELPNEKRVFGFLNHFPLPGLFMQTVRKSLHHNQVDMVYCSEEADVELARAASGNANCYVFGQDSDFFFYKDIQYVPFDCVFIENDAIHACVGKRKDLAMLLGIDDEAMVELAILLGNDYIQSMKVPKKDGFDRGDPLYVARYLGEQLDGFLVSSSNKYAKELAFVRALYNLDDLDSFPLEDASGIDESALDEHEDFAKHLRSELPFDVAKEADSALQAGLGLAETVQRCLSWYVEQTSSDKSATLGLVHLKAYDELVSSSTTNNKTFELDRRPQWSHVLACYVIEKCVSVILKSPRSSLLDGFTQPSTLFSHYRFHSILASKETNEVGGDISPDDRATESIKEEPVSVLSERKMLPIDAHEDRIIRNIANNRVTIIHGETGCGKSSRVPVMVLNAPSPEPTLPRVKFFISQPRRIAAKGLVERVRSCEPEHRQKFAIRMGHGWREYETKHTQAWFVTTGYLTRLLANHPERFDGLTHLIIDEVHERSVDTDILCLLCRRLLERNKTIRLVLMSATLATKLYKEYFMVPNDPIHVGVRTYPIVPYFVEDLHKFKLPRNEMKAAGEIVKECQKKRCNSTPTAFELAKRFSLAANLAKAVGKPGTSVLIFVPGMNEIVVITECIEKFMVAGKRYTTCPIHSDIPFEEQMEAFKEPDKDEVKIIIATNAAESSVTLPTVDHVICLGLCRQIDYNPTTHRQILLPMWISQASAKQRAGRTGRVRPGNVYRLYTRETFENFMDEFDPGEISRVPLDSIILMLKEMLHEEVIPVLCNCIEPPSMDTIDRSFESLYRSNFIEEPDDEADITSLGCFVSSLGIDLTLGSLIGLGIQFGVAAEAIEMAAMMSFPKAPFQVANTLFHDSTTFNKITSGGYVSRCHFDANLYSEPMSLMNALAEYDAAPNKVSWCFKHSMAVARMKQLSATRKSLRTRVAKYFGINENVLIPETPPVLMPHAKVNILRILQVWVFPETIIETWPPKNVEVRSHDGSATLSVQKGVIEKAQLDKVLHAARHPYEILNSAHLKQVGHFNYQGIFELDTFIVDFQAKLVSYMVEVNVDLVACDYGNNLYLFRQADFDCAKDTISGFDSLECAIAEQDIVVDQGWKAARRGISERKCGAWTARVVNNDERIPPEGKIYKRFHIQECPKETKVLLLNQIDKALMRDEIKSYLHWCFPIVPERKKKTISDTTITEQKFSVVIRGACQAISHLDLKDLLASSEIHSLVRNNGVTRIRFHQMKNKPLVLKKPGKDELETTIKSSWKRPLLHNIPEGARLLGVLASGASRAGGPRLQFAKKEEKSETLGDSATVEVHLDRWISNLNSRWKRHGTEGKVFVQPHTVPTSAFNSTGPLFACCSNALEVGGGIIRVEGVTLLPRNPLFLLLSILSFGLQAKTTSDNGQPALEAIETQELIFNAAVGWMGKQKQKLAKCGIQNPEFDLNSNGGRGRIATAIEFNNVSERLGASLLCHSDSVLALCNLFSYVDGYEMALWDSLADTAFTEENLSKWRRGAKWKVAEKKPGKVCIESEAKRHVQEGSKGRKISNVIVASWLDGSAATSKPEAGCKNSEPPNENEKNQKRKQKKRGAKQQQKKEKKDKKLKQKEEKKAKKAKEKPTHIFQVQNQFE
ncbi:unnamed protein product [Cylindrotheca closterium]|uniref:Uncharacterized protein n=1 Tax=Cylindrotheca closterium TaxID=2856 RepID=A0AAD2FDY1_9STRA|nr:unnamed protein product [Cylindrotheca closterium]